MKMAKMIHLLILGNFISKPYKVAIMNFFVLMNIHEHTTGMEFLDGILQGFPMLMLIGNSQDLWMKCKLYQLVFGSYMYGLPVSVCFRVIQPLGTISLVLLPIVPLGRGSNTAHPHPLYNLQLAHLCSVTVA